MKRIATSRFLIVGTLACLFGWGAVLAADKTDDEKKKEENKTPAELLEESEEKTSVSGIFRLMADTLRDGKPLPKPIGFIAGQGQAFQVFVRDETTMSKLVVRNGQRVVVSGVWADGGEKGRYLLADNLIESDLPPPARRKRGGL